MKSTIISMIIVLVLLIVVPLVFLGDNDFAEQLGFKMSSERAELNAKTPKNITNVVTDKEVEVYKWVDDYEVTQFSHSPPMMGGEWELIVLKPDTNVIDAIKIPEEEEKKPERPQVFSVGSPYTPDGLKDLIEQSEGIQDLVDSRQEQQQKALEEMFKQK
jgi:hypothetical protein